MDMEAWIATFADNAISHDPVGGPPLDGHNSLRQFFQGIVGAFDTVGLTEDKVFISGNGAAVMWTGRGVGKNGREVTFEGIDVFEINEEGKIQTLWAYWDPSAMMAKLQS
jgi:steroid delta-isomerase